MAEFFDVLLDEHQRFIARQPIFFVATAAGDGSVNLSPKGGPASPCSGRIACSG